MLWLPVISIIVIGTAGPFVFRKMEIAGRRKYLSERETLTDDELCARYHKNTTASRAVFLQAWRRLGRILHIEYGKLRPEDPLQNLLGLPKWLGSYGSSHFDDLEYELSQCLPEKAIVDTVAKVIDAFSHCPKEDR